VTDPSAPRRDAADRLLDKLRAFAAELDPDERVLLAALLAPGIDAAWSPDPDGEPGDAEVAGFAVSWSPTTLPQHLTDAIRARDLRVEGW
jgi:hypothetical protein